jgi:hypothetical protein
MVYIKTNPTHTITFGMVFVYVSTVRPANGTYVDFHIDNTPAASHATLVDAMSEASYGSTMSGNFPLVRDIISRVVPTSATLGVDHIDNHTLVCVSKSEEARDMVFTLVRHGTPLDTSPSVQTARNNNYSFRAILRLCTTRDGSQYIHNLVFPNAVCKVSLANVVSSDATQPTVAWLRLLNGFGISDTNASESRCINAQNLERFCVRNAHIGMPVAVEPRSVRFTTPVDNMECMSDDLSISFFRGDKCHSVNIQASMLQDTFTQLINTHEGILQNFSTYGCDTEHKISLNNGAYELVFSTKHPARVQCLLLCTTAGGRVVASSDVNFSNNMVHTTVHAAGVDHVFGIQRLALRAACRLQSNLTSGVIARRLVSSNAVDDHGKMLQLIASTDIATDFDYVFRSGGTSNKLRDDDESMEKLRLRVTSLDMKKENNSVENIRVLQNIQFNRSPVFLEKRATSSTRAERPRWQDASTTGGRSDNLMRQKMMSARGVATLSLYTDLKYGIKHPDTCVVFSTVNVPKLVYKVPKSVSGPCMSAKKLNWLATPSACDVRGKSPTPHHFMHAFNSSSKEMRVFNRHNGAEKTEHTFAIFVKEDSVRDNSKVFVQQGVSKGSLVAELFKCSETHSSVYTRALAHLVLLDTMFRLGKICKKTSWNQYSQKWLNKYRAHFLGSLPLRRDVTGAQSDQQYIDYCIFTQCLKQHINGIHMPCDSFSSLVQQGIPFPYV